MSTTWENNVLYHFLRLSPYRMVGQTPHVCLVPIFLLHATTDDGFFTTCPCLVTVDIYHVGAQWTASWHCARHTILQQSLQHRSWPLHRPFSFYQANDTFFLLDPTMPQTCFTFIRPQAQNRTVIPVVYLSSRPLLR